MVQGHRHRRAARSSGGAVVDANGPPRPGIGVTVTGSGGRPAHVTGGDGAYTAAGLATGDDVVTAVLPGSAPGTGRVHCAHTGGAS